MVKFRSELGFNWVDYLMLKLSKSVNEYMSLLHSNTSRKIKLLRSRKQSHNNFRKRD